MVADEKWESPEHANAWLTDDRSHGDDYIAEAADRVFAMLSPVRRGKRGDTVGYVAKVLRVADDLERADGE